MTPHLPTPHSPQVQSHQKPCRRESHWGVALSDGCLRNSFLCLGSLELVTEPVTHQSSDSDTQPEPQVWAPHRGCHRHRCAGATSAWLSRACCLHFIAFLGLWLPGSFLSFQRGYQFKTIFHSILLRTPVCAEQEGVQGSPDGYAVRSLNLLFMTGCLSTLILPLTSGSTMGEPGSLGSNSGSTAD